jgi:hypothetical protein
MSYQAVAARGGPPSKPGERGRHAHCAQRLNVPAQRRPRSDQAYVRRRNSESSADDLRTWQGVVPGRAASCCDPLRLSPTPRDSFERRRLRAHTRAQQLTSDELCFFFFHLENSSCHFGKLIELLSDEAQSRRRVRSFVRSSRRSGLLFGSSGWVCAYATAVEREIFFAFFFFNVLYSIYILLL